MNSRKLTLTLLAWVFLFGVGSQRTIVGQSTLVTIPSTDVVSARNVYLGITF
jgi:hypothetical protein